MKIFKVLQRQKKRTEKAKQKNRTFDEQNHFEDEYDDSAISHHQNMKNIFYLFDALLFAKTIEYTCTLSTNKKITACVFQKHPQK